MKKLFTYASLFLTLGLAVATPDETQTTPVLFSMRSLTGSVNNRTILITPDTVQDPLVIGTNLIPIFPFTIQPVGGQVITNLAPWGYSIRVDGWPRSAHILVTNSLEVINAASLINTNAFAPLNIFNIQDTNAITQEEWGALTNGDLAIPGVITNGADATLGNVVASSYAGDGNGLLDLVAGNIARGTMSDARLSANVPLLNIPNTFTATQTGTFSGDGSLLTGLTNGLVTASVTNGLATTNYVNAAIAPMITNFYTLNGNGTYASGIALSNLFTLVNLSPVNSKVQLSGTFVITNALPTLTLNGLEISGSTITQSNKNFGGLRFSAADNLFIHNLTVVADINNPPLSTNCDGIVVDAGGRSFSEDVRIENNYVAGFNNSIRVRSVLQVEIAGNKLGLCNSNMIWVDAPTGQSSDSITITRNDLNSLDFPAPSWQDKNLITAIRLNKGIDYLIFNNNGGGCEHAIFADGGTSIMHVNNNWEAFFSYNATNTAVVVYTNMAGSVIDSGNKLSGNTGDFGSSNYLAQIALWNCFPKNCLIQTPAALKIDVFGNDTPLACIGQVYIHHHTTFLDTGTTNQYDNGTLANFAAGASFNGDLRMTATIPNLGFGVIGTSGAHFGTVTASAFDGSTMGLMQFNSYAANKADLYVGASPSGSTPGVSDIFFMTSQNAANTNTPTRWWHVDSAGSLTAGNGGNGLAVGYSSGPGPGYINTSNAFVCRNLVGMTLTQIVVTNTTGPHGYTNTYTGGILTSASAY